MKELSNLTMYRSIGDTNSEVQFNLLDMIIDIILITLPNERLFRMLCMITFAIA